MSWRNVLSRRNSAHDNQFITVSVALFAIVVFTVSGSQLFPAIVHSRGDMEGIDPGQVSAFLLNIALVLFAWRRSVQLRQTSAECSEAKQKVYKLEYFDEVTGLFNRRRFNEQLAKICKRRKAEATLLLVDLDHFKKINDLYGHPVGDGMLVAIAKRLTELAPAGASTFRIGGDEFALLFSDTALSQDTAEELAGRICDRLIQPVKVGKTVTAVGASIGIAALAGPGHRPEELVKRADVALYEAKRRGRDRFVYFDSAMELLLGERAQLEAEMRDGLTRGEFVPYFQPIFDLLDGNLRGFEVLARWNHPTRGVLEPPAFLELAEHTGLISDLSFAVMHHALQTARTWRSDLKIAVNISRVQFNDPLLSQRILKVLATTGFPPGRLELEVFEKCLLDDRDTALATIEGLRNAGIAVSVEDFGTGYAPLMDIGKMPFDRIKIDRSFVQSLIGNESCDALVRAVASLGKGLSMPMTAEGVESAEVQQKLNELGCTDVQGWLFGKALSPEEVEIGFAPFPEPAREAMPDAPDRRAKKVSGRAA